MDRVNENYLYIVPSLLFVTVILAFFGVSAYRDSEAGLVKKRLERIASLSIPSYRARELAKPITERVIFPSLRRAVTLITAIAPKAIRESIKRKLEESDNPWNISLGEYIALKLVSAFGLPILLLLLSLALGAGPAQSLILGMCGVVIGLLLPEVLMQRRKRARDKEIRKGLPDVLDLLTVSVEAGLGFDSALAKVVERKKGPLSEEFATLLQDIRMGRPRREALRALAERVKIQEISSLVASIIQADQLGIGIANTLRIQANQLRIARRQQAEEAAMKAPIKMLIPLVFFIFPTIFVVLLGPAVIQVITTFMGMGK